MGRRHGCSIALQKRLDSGQFDNPNFRPLAELRVKRRRSAYFRAEQYSSRWPDRQTRGVWGVFAIQSPRNKHPRIRLSSPPGSQRCSFISRPFRCKFKSALIQSTFPASRRWDLVVKTASVQLKDVFTNHTDTFCSPINWCPPAPTATLAFFCFARRHSHCLITLRFTDKDVCKDSKRDVHLTSFDVFFQSVVDS